MSELELSSTSAPSSESSASSDESTSTSSGETEDIVSSVHRSSEFYASVFKVVSKEVSSISSSVGNYFSKYVGLVGIFILAVVVAFIGWSSVRIP